MAGKRADKPEKLKGHALRNFNLRKRSLKRSETAPPLSQKAVEIRVNELGMTRIQLARESGISRGALRDLELGVHNPTRYTLERFIEFCEHREIKPALIETVRNLYAGPCDSLQHFIARLELRAGSSPELARKVGISPATLWEYKRGNFPTPYALLKKMCTITGEDFELGEELWRAAERNRFLQRGFPRSFAELCVLRLRAGHAESKLLQFGLATSQLKRMCYLELPPWPRVLPTAKSLCRTPEELKDLKDLWLYDFQEQKSEGLHDFGLQIKKLREKRNIQRREISDLCLVGGKKPARTIKHIEEDGHYSQLAFPAGLVAIVTEEPPPPNMNGSTIHCPVKRGVLETPLAKELRSQWEKRRLRFHLRHRPEMQIDLRLAREYYGFDVAEAARQLGYTSLEYQKIERGIEPLSDTARKRILEAYEKVGHQRVAEVFQRRDQRDLKRIAWKTPNTVSEMLTLLAKREGGVVTLARVLKGMGLYGISTPQLRSYILGAVTPSWSLLQQIADKCGIAKLQPVHIDWIKRYRTQLKSKCKTMLCVEIKLLVAELAPTMRAFAKRCSCSPSLLLRDLYRIEDGETVKWKHIERFLRGAGLPDTCERWQVIHGLWLRGE